ncbi:MAG: hypothetical protein FWE14_11245 [Lachnospiraceae bacterium]|nr:hypothetical protein [Lachnospiraceae bacterium]
MIKTKLELRKKELESELTLAEYDLIDRDFYCQSCAEKTSKEQYTTQGSYVLTVVSCRYGYNEIKNHFTTTNENTSPRYNCPKFKDAHDKIDRLKKEIKKLDSDIMQSQKQEEYKIVEPKKVISVNTTAEALTERGYIFLEDSEWKTAKDYFDNALDINPKYGEAYVGLLCAELRVNKEADLANNSKALENIPHYKKALRFGDVDCQERLVQYNKAIIERINEEAKLRQKRIADEERRERKAQKARIEREAEEARQEQVRITEENRKRNKRISELKCLIENALKYKTCIAVGNCHAIGLKSDGAVVTVGDNMYGQCDVGGWHDIIAVSAGAGHTVGLRIDGTVVAVGDNEHGQCDVDDWCDIIAVSTNWDFTVGLTSDGTVVAVGDNEYGQCDVDDWYDIISISTGMFHTVGLKRDGTVVAVGFNKYGECDVGGWSNIVAICANHGTYGLKLDGTVVAIGYNIYYSTVSDWCNIVAFSTGAGAIYGIKSDGTLVAGHITTVQSNVSVWRDIIAISTNSEYELGLKSDGTVVAVGELACFEKIEGCIENWSDIGLSTENIISEKEQFEQALNDMTQRVMENTLKYIQQGLCPYCGGQFGGLFTKKCKSCGKKA